MRIALFATTNRPKALVIVQHITELLLQAGQQVRMAPELAHACVTPNCAVPEDEVVIDADLAMAIGGDGTMLRAVRNAAPHGVPIIGLNAGALGFLTELTPDQLPDYLPRILNGDYAIEQRMMISGQLLRESQVIANILALNDIVIHQGGKGRLIHLDVTVAGSQLGHFGADGVIFSTPTGSTAYGMAAGGPIINPTATVIALVPICPHSLSFRPMVIPTTDVIQVFCGSNQHDDEMMVTADGQDPIPARYGDRVIIQPAQRSAQLVKLDLFSFYDRLREKLQWGGGT